MDKIVTIQEQIQQKIKYGDFITLGAMLGITSDNAKMRFRRGKEDAVQGMLKIIASRETLLSTSQENKQ
jgi:hypothetical protein